MQRWRWDEGTGALTPDGAALQLGRGGVQSLAAEPGPDGALQLLAGCHDGKIRVLGVGASGGLQQQAALVWHSSAIRGLSVMTTLAAACRSR